VRPPSPPTRPAGGIGPAPGLFASWLLLLLLALRVQRETQAPPIPIGAGASRALTIVFLMGWVLGIFWAILSMPPSTQGRGLVTTGPFARVRHPLYAISLFYLGLLTIASSRSWVVAAVWPLSYVVARFWVGFEEKGLDARFGEAWRDYAARTPRFLPWPRRFGASGSARVSDDRVPGSADPG
jgi:protein-S-isoprenylcysteine O-methyltransferase Ste14